ncbi:MAG: UMP kinase [Candidatus Eisenbacteria bacterium]|nr:UMP kinase [Candidatus Eisenbacteria bacterium]
MGHVTRPVHKRVLLKLSGEILAGSQRVGLDFPTLTEIAEQIQAAHRLGCEVGVVIGGGNIFRGQTAAQYGVDRSAADTVGMIATSINALVLQDRLESLGMHTRVLSAVRMEQICEPFIRRRAVRHLEKGRIVLFAAGTGNPYFTTDTAAVLRALEIRSEVVLKGTRVDGVYDHDPERVDSARLYTKITFQEALQRRLRVMDLTALTLCMENRLPVIVFNIKAAGNLERVLRGEAVGTRIGFEEEGERRA